MKVIFVTSTSKIYELLGPNIVNVFIAYKIYKEVELEEINNKSNKNRFIVLVTSYNLEGHKLRERRAFFFALFGNMGSLLHSIIYNFINREKYQDTPGSSSIYQNAPGSSKFTKLPLCPKKYTL